VRLPWSGAAALVVEAAVLVEVLAFGVAVRDRLWASKAIARTETATVVATPSAAIVVLRLGRRAGDGGPLSPPSRRRRTGWIGGAGSSSGKGFTPRI
jgi:hypothetical protein